MDPERWPSLEWPPLPAELRARFAIVDQVLKVGHPELINGAQTWDELDQAWSDFQARPVAMTSAWSDRILRVLDRLASTDDLASVLGLTRTQDRRWSTLRDIQEGSGLRTRHVQGALAWLLEREAVQVRGCPREYRIR